jgi:excisionase family DNA binding protein
MEDTKEMLPDVITDAQLARYLQLTLITIWRLRKAGELPGRKVGMHWRTRINDVRAMFGVGPI